MKKIVFITGGARSGKSTLAVELARKRRGPVVFVASCEPADIEMRERVRKHRRDRPAAWKTIEEPVDLAGAVRSASSAGVVIVDCLTLWVSNLMARRMKEPEILRLTADLTDAARKGKASVIIVSNEVGWGIVPTNKTARLFRDIAGRVHQAVARESDEVYLTVAGLPVKIK